MCMVGYFIVGISVVVYIGFYIYCEKKYMD